MRRFVLVLLLGCCAWATPPLLVTSVVRKGLPPYEGTERLYQLEGPGCQTLRVGETLVLHRQGDPRNLGRLEILAVHLDHAQARLSVPGDTFPLKGDLAIRTELCSALPGISIVAQSPIPNLNTLLPRAITHTLPQPVGQGASYREPLYFIKGNASLSPGAQAKLKAWVDAWGAEGQWSLECPQASSPLSIQRLSVLRSELQRLGLPELTIKPLPEEPPGHYDTIYVKKEP